MSRASPIRVGVVGCSNLGRKHARRFAESERSVLAAYCDLDAQARETMRQQVCDPLGVAPSAWEDAEKLIDSGSHLLNTMLCVAGLEPKRVHAEIDFQDQEVDVNSALTIRFWNGAVGSVTVLGQTKMPGMRGDIVVTGEEGDVVLPKGFHGAGGIEVYGPDGPREDVVLPEDTTPPENFLGVIRGEEASLSPPRDAVRLARLMDAIYASAEQGRPVECAPASAA